MHIHTHVHAHTSKAKLSNFQKYILIFLIFQFDSDNSESVCNAGDPGSIPESGRPPPGERKGYP